MCVGAGGAGGRGGGMVKLGRAFPAIVMGLPSPG